MTEPKPVPREVQARIVEDLARGHRSIASIAARHHVPADLVFKLRDLHGPGLADLSEAARKLRRPGGRPADATGHEATPEPAPVEVRGATPRRFRRGYQDGLTSEERRTCRAWAGLPVNSRQAPKDARDRWVAAGRPQAAPIVCGACGEPLPDATADGCPFCDAEFERVQADKHAEWSEFYVRCLTIPESATECEAVAAAVYRLRDAHAEHLHREQLVQRVQDAIKPHLHLTLNQVRLVLDAIEAA